MKRLLLLSLIFTIPIFAQAPSIPNRAFDVRNGNGVIDAGTTYPAAIVIPFKDAAAKQKWLDDYAEANNWENQRPQQTKQAFALDGIKLWMKGQSIGGRQTAIRKTTFTVDESDLPQQ